MDDRRNGQSGGVAMNKVRFFLGIAALGLGFLAVTRRLLAPRRMPFAGLWGYALAERRGEAAATRVIALAEARYDELCQGRPRQANRALRVHLERGLLPGLALYQTLLEQGDTQEEALAEMEQLMASTVSRLTRLMALLGRLPRPFAIFRLVEPWVIRLGFPAEGWEMEPVENSADCIAFNVRRCIYVDTLASYGAPELTPVFCGGDDVMFPALAPSITWERTMTLGRGDDRCDFRWRRAASLHRP